MNIIKMYNDYVKESIIESDIEITKVRKSEFFSVNKLKLRIKKDADILIKYEGDKDYKLDFYLELDENVTCNIKEIRTNVQSKIRNTYTLKRNSKLNMERFLNSNKMRLLDVVNLDGNNSICDFKMKGITDKDTKYDAIIYHNDDFTNLDIDYKSINSSNEKEIINITDIIPSKIKKYKVNQKIKTITSNKDNCTVNAYVLVDENKIDNYSFVDIVSLDDEIDNILKTKKISNEKIRNILKEIKNFDYESIIDNNSLENLKSYWRWYDE